VLLVGSLALWFLRPLTKGSHWFGRIARTLDAAKGNLIMNRKLVVAVVLSFALHLLNFLIIFLFARALTIPISYEQILLMMPVILFLVLIPVTVNGHGLREILLIGYFTYMGVAVTGHAVRETALALSVLIVANDLIWSVPGGLWYLLSSRERATDGENRMSTQRKQGS
jgi:uncharacterized membrane protein YbhN (UPF0104 family)